MSQAYVLKIRWMQDDTVVEDRFLHAKGEVSIGSDPSNTFITDQGQIVKHSLFLKNDRGYLLSFLDGMTGVITLADNTKVSLEQLKEKARKVGKSYRVQLPERVKGKIVLGRTTILFQMVPPPPALQPLHLPRRMRGGLHATFDPIWMGFLVFSAILHIGTLVYVGTKDLPPREDLFATAAEVQDIPLNESEITLVPEVEIPEPEIPEAPGEGEGGEEEEPAPEKPVEQPPQPQKTQTAQQAPKEEDVTTKGILGLITAKKKRPGAFVNILDSASDRDVEEVVSKITGVQMAKRDVDIEAAKRARGISGKTGRTVDIEGLGKKPLTNLQGVEIEEKKRIAKVDVSGTIKPVSANLLGEDYARAVRDTVSENSTGIKYCYDRELKRNPTLRGKVVVEFTIGTDGRVKKFRIVEQDTTLQSDSVTSCILRKVKRWRFPKPQKAITLQFPFVFSAVT